MTGSLILDIAYGIKVKPENDEYIEIAEKGQEGMEASGDPNIVDILPWGMSPILPSDHVCSCSL